MDGKFLVLLALNLVTLAVSYNHNRLPVLNKDLNFLYQQLDEIYRRLGSSRRNDFSYHDSSDLYGPDRTSEKNYRRELLMPKNGQLFEGDIVMDARLREAVDGAYYNKRTVMNDEELKWPNGVVPYVLDDSVDPEILPLIKEGIKQFTKRTCIKLIKRTNETDYLRFSSKEDVCSSHIGRQGGEQVVFLGRNCNILGTVLHEIMHNLGFIHEHSRFDRDKHIRVNFQNIKEDDAINFQKYRMGDTNNLNQEYNLESLMQYRHDAFTKNGLATIEPIDTEDMDLDFGQRLQFSIGDVDMINMDYNCKVDKEVAHKDLIPNYAGYHVELERKRKDARKKLENDLKKYYKYKNLV